MPRDQYGSKYALKLFVERMAVAQSSCRMPDRKRLQRHVVCSKGAQIEARDLRREPEAAIRMNRDSVGSNIRADRSACVRRMRASAFTMQHLSRAPLSYTFSCTMSGHRGIFCVVLLVYFCTWQVVRGSDGVVRVPLHIKRSRHPELPARATTAAMRRLQNADVQLTNFMDTQVRSRSDVCNVLLLL